MYLLFFCESRSMCSFYFFPPDREVRVQTGKRRGLLDHMNVNIVAALSQDLII